MHLAAAVPAKPGGPAHRPCVVVAGGREPPTLGGLSAAPFLSTVGASTCCAEGGCWRSRCQPVGDGDDKDRNNLLRAPVAAVRRPPHPQVHDAHHPGRRDPQDRIVLRRRHPPPTGLHSHSAPRPTERAVRYGRWLPRRPESATHPPCRRYLVVTRNERVDPLPARPGRRRPVDDVLGHLAHYHPDWRIDIAAWNRQAHAPIGGLCRPGDRPGPRPVGAAPVTTACSIWTGTSPPPVYPDCAGHQGRTLSARGLPPAAVAPILPLHDPARCTGPTSWPVVTSSRVSRRPRTPTVATGLSCPLRGQHFAVGEGPDSGVGPAPCARKFWPRVRSRHPRLGPANGAGRRRAVHNPHADEELWGGTGTGDAEALAALIEHSALLVGVDSGPLHVAGATTTPTVGVWLRHHPLHYFGLADNVLHLVPDRHETHVRGDRAAAPPSSGSLPAPRLRRPGR